MSKNIKKLLLGFCSFLLLADVCAMTHFTKVDVLYASETEDVNTTTSMIYQWSWPKDVNIVKTEKQDWELPVSGASQKNPISHRQLLTLLPSEILVHENGGQKPLKIAWDVTEIPEPIWTGNYVISATIVDPTYHLSEEAAELSCTVCFQETDIALQSLADHTIKGISPSSTKIDLFDYWITNENDPDNIFKEEYRLYGINGFKGVDVGVRHGLLFGIGSNYGWANTTDSSSTPKQGIVENVLYKNGNTNKDGYPRLKSSSLSGDKDSTNSNIFVQDFDILDYLFDPANLNNNIFTGGKKSYENVKGLLQIDKDGYYSYNSDENFAELNKQQKTFTLYDTPAMKENKGLSGGQFFPLNSASDMFQETNGKLSSKILSEVDAKLNHYFGLTMTTSFVQQKGGTNRGKPVTYSFMGDDDVWVFIDGVLVGDVGGCHAATNLDINFQTGEVRVYGNIGTNFDKRTTIKAAFEAAGKATTTGFSGNTFADDTIHTLKFFYLERGHAQANLRLRYNLIPKTETSLIKTDENGKALENATFSLYQADASYQTLNEVSKIITDKNGYAAFMDDEGNPITLESLKNISNYFVLKESGTPQGYRQTKDIQLQFVKAGSNYALKVNNQWNSGAFARTNIAPTFNLKTIKKIDGSSLNYDSTYITLSSGIIFAVVMKNDNGVWKPVYGNDADGWKVAKDGSFTSLKAAIRKNPNVLVEKGMTGENRKNIPLPGNINAYDFAGGSDFKIAYYYSMESSVDEINYTYEIDELDVATGYSYTYGATLQITDVADTLLVQKLDAAQEPLTGAEFAMYEESGLNVKEDGTYTINSGAKVLQTVTTKNLTEALDGVTLRGGAKFAVSAGTYYIIETKAPAGYVKNDLAVKVVVDTNGVSVNANRENDGIYVKKGIDSLYSSMLQYADADGIDATLHGLKMQLETTDNLDGTWNKQPDSTHLQYTATGYDSITGKAYLGTDVGWSRLNLQQCLEHDSASVNANKQKLDSTNVAGSFKDQTIVQVTNQKVSSLEIKKQVDGEATSSAFTFKIKLTEPKAQSYTAEIYNASGNLIQTMTIDKEATFSLKDKETLRIPTMNYQTSYEIAEINIPASYDVSVQVNQGEVKKQTSINGTIAYGENLVVFTNTVHSKADFRFIKTTNKQVPLAGAGFVLYELNCTEDTHDHANEKISVDQYGQLKDTTEKCWKKFADTNSVAATGEVLFHDLNTQMEYRLIEYKAPSGYLQPDGQWKLSYDTQTKKFIVNGIVGSVTGTPAFEKINMSSADYRLPNYQPNDLPSTGHGGNTIAYVIGGILLMLGGFGMYRYRTRREGG